MNATKEKNRGMKWNEHGIVDSSRLQLLRNRDVKDQGTGETAKVDMSIQDIPSTFLRFTWSIQQPLNPALKPRKFGSVCRAMVN